MKSETIAVAILKIVMCQLVNVSTITILFLLSCRSGINYQRVSQDFGN